LFILYLLLIFSNLLLSVIVYIVDLFNITSILQMNDEMKTDMMDILRISLAPLISRLDVIDTRLDGIDTRLDGIDTRLDGIDTRLDGIDTRLDGIEASQARSLALQKNSLKGRTEALCKVPNAHGIIPDIPFPPTLSHLVVAGNERMPLGPRNTWTKSQSIDYLLRFYEAEDVYDSETENEYTPTARSSRLKLAKVIGISSMQYQQAVASLCDS
jgi:hypothetical protein